MQTISKHLPWIQLILIIGGYIFIYGQQSQSLKDMERRTTQCEEKIRNVNINSTDVLNKISDIRVDISEIKTDIRYLRKDNNHDK